jgi:hypothetical protein
MDLYHHSPIRLHGVVINDARDCTIHLLRYAVYCNDILILVREISFFFFCNINILPYVLVKYFVRVLCTSKRCCGDWGIMGIIYRIYTTGSV